MVTYHISLLTDIYRDYIFKNISSGVAAIHRLQKPLIVNYYMISY